jgi:hypothetical protein
LAALPGCVIFSRNLTLPGGEDAVVLLLSGAMPPPIDEVGRHSWFAVRRRGEREWRRIEYGGGPSDPLRYYGDGDTILHNVWRGAAAERAIACLIEHAETPLRKIRRSYLA